VIDNAGKIGVLVIDPDLHVMPSIADGAVEMGCHLMLIHFARTPQKVRKVPATDMAGGLVIQAQLNFGFQYAKFFRLLRRRGRSLGEFVHDPNIARVSG
jgi:hypothetical protein